MEDRWTEAIADMVAERDAARFHFRVQGQSMAPTLLPGDEVVIEHVRLEMLRPGDLILLQNGDQPIVHRFLGVRHKGGRRFLRTVGDGKWRLDPPCREETLRGRVIAAYREGQPLQPATGRWRAWFHRARSGLWNLKDWVRALLPFTLLLALALRADMGWAAVTLVSFEAEWDGGRVHVSWQTASEVDSLGFYVLRSDQENGDFSRITDLIPAEGDIAGASYAWDDGNVSSGTVYYYALEEIGSAGGSNLHGPVSTAGSEPTPTSTPTPSPTATITSSPSPSPSPSATPSSSATPTSTPSPSATFTATPSASPTPSPAASLTSTPTPKISATPSPMPSSTATIGPSSTASRTPTASAPPTSTSTPESVETPLATIPPPTSTPTPLAETVTSTVLSNLETATSLPTALPSATETPAESIAQHSGGADSDSGGEAAADQEPARAKQRLNLVLAGIGGTIVLGLVLIALVLVIFALYRWGYLRLG